MATAGEPPPRSTSRSRRWWQSYSQPDPGSSIRGARRRWRLHCWLTVQPSRVVKSSPATHSPMLRAPHLLSSKDPAAKALHTCRPKLALLLIWKKAVVCSSFFGVRSQGSEA
ncbi:hypothetical protein BDA96_08G074200 [Sorghum bicolor]|uniref:Uncharacterized protein n=1 Tax=Sorghum bicolor TaxID=4558 RepID=A0A921U6C8_SORBI|nr:hypothetical protein BDA96_08G074200 [Sorghum bicolor]